ncbi:MAG: DUF1553 domain-containing protein [Planctomycetes bacterium]|nr:DUF1553 domain-containing protein [Planctomycetota bacterium]
MIRAFITSLTLQALMVGAAFADPVALPDGRRIDKVDFERHVQALLGKHGCNSGACHGSLQGRGGFYLSLFGYSAQKDHDALTRHTGGRRVSVANPERSLMLLKPTGQVTHGGEVRFSPDSWQHHLIRAWIAAGADWTPGAGKVARVEVQPSEHVFTKAGETKQLKVIVHFADNTQEDMTLLCDFRAYDDFVAAVSPTGEVKSLRPGETPILVTYRGHIQAARVFTPVTLGVAYPKVPEVNYVDREVFGKLRKLNIIPSDLSSDTEFLRRVTIDTIGSLPSPDEVRTFLASNDPDKRTKKIDELLQHPLHAALWATRFCDITANNIDVMDGQPQLKAKRAKMWHDWFRKRVQDNMPYDQIAKGVLTATSRDKLEPLAWVKQTGDIDQAARVGFNTDYANRASLDLFWRRVQGNVFFSIENMAELTATAFMGVRIECAQCHKHPTDQWTQADYRAFANVFSQVQLGSSPEIRAAVTKDQQDRQKAIKEANDVIDKELKARRTEVETKFEAEFAPKRKVFDEMLAKEIAARKEAAEKAAANEPAVKQKMMLAAADKAIAAYRLKTQTTFDKDAVTQRKKAMAPIDQEAAKRKLEVNSKFNKGGFNPGTLTEVFIGPKLTRTLAHPDTKTTLTPKALGGPELSYDGDARAGLHRWLVQADNPFFARSFVNRVWAHYFGQGLVEPVDSFSAANPPSNEKLLDALAKDFIDSKFDIRRLERTILLSRTYQLSATPNDTNRQDKNAFARSYPRRPMAEIVIDMLTSALGVSEDFGLDVPKGSRAIELAPNKLQNQQFANILRIFGRPPRTATCDCERAMEPALPQTLYLMTDVNLLNKMTKGRLSELLASKKTDEEILDELFLATLTRMPNERERSIAKQSLERASTRQAGFVNVLWALINTREFVLNH